MINRPTTVPHTVSAMVTPYEPRIILGERNTSSYALRVNPLGKSPNPSFATILSVLKDAEITRINGSKQMSA